MRHLCCILMVLLPLGGLGRRACGAQAGIVSTAALYEMVGMARCGATVPSSNARAKTSQRDVATAVRFVEGETNAFDDFLLAPLRVHLLQAKDAPAIHTTLEPSDVRRILWKVNGIWSQAGIHFYLESLRIEEAARNEFTSHREGLLPLRPEQSKSGRVFHVYYLKELTVNGIHFREANFVKDTARLRTVPGGIDEPLPRVTAHELGHALGLPHRQSQTNLMASGTTGTELNAAEIEMARRTAIALPWVQRAPDVLREADKLYEGGRQRESRESYRELEGIAGLPERVRERRSQLPENEEPRVSGGDAQ